MYLNNLSNMSITCVESAFHNDEDPPFEVIEFINSLTLKKTSKKVIERDFLHLLNIISHTNKESFIPKIKKNIMENWKDENKEIFIKIIFNQPLYTNIFLEIFEFFDKTSQNDILSEINNKSLEVHHSMLFGKFMAILYQKQKKQINEIIKICEQKIEKYPGFVISFLCEFNKYKNDELRRYSEECIQKIQSKKLDTKILMHLFDLQSIIEN